MCEPVILPSAQKRGYPEEGIFHAYYNALDVFEQDDDMIMLIGSARNGTPMEVGVIAGSDGTPLIAHTMMPARNKYMRAGVK
jgi:uncharacterized phosphosugar-binding protein